MNDNSLYETESERKLQNNGMIAPSAPSAQEGYNVKPPLYPVLNYNSLNSQNAQNSQNYKTLNQTFTCNSQQFRLVEIQKMRDTVEAKIKHNEAKSKRYKRQAVATEYVNAVLSTVSVLCGSSAAITTLPLVSAPLALPLGIISAVSGVTSGIILAISRSRRKKLSQVTDYLISEKSTYNAIINYVSKAINDSFITDDEFLHISKLYENMEYTSLKNIIKKDVKDDVNQLAIEIASFIAANYQNNKNNNKQ